MTSAWTRETPIGVLTLTEEAGALTGVLFGPDAPEGALRMETPLIRRAFAQLEEYFRGERKAFDLPMDARGTPFQRRCWRALLEIPYGQTRTCAQIADELGNAEGFRAVGAAVRKNPLALLVPAHRVVDAAGKPLGEGRSAQLKGALLRMEREAAARTR